ncbi:MAG: NAD(P)-dependent oxidoreductase [Chloroflexota bacterium]
MRILVTGGSGFIGAHVLELLKAIDDVEIYATTRQQKTSDDITWQTVDLFDAGAVTKLMQTVQPTHLLHFAWDVTPSKYWTSLDNYRWVQASLHLLMTFHEQGGRRAVFAGTCAEYNWDYGYLIENHTPITAQTPYGNCKANLYQLIMNYAQQVELSVGWGRIFFPFGSGEKPERLVPYVIRSLLNDTVAETSSGTQLRDFLYVKDMARAFVALLQSDVQGAVNMASGNPLRLADFIHAIGDALGKRELIKLGARPDGNQPTALLADTTRLHKEVGFIPQYTRQEGIQETIAWWREQERENKDE